MMKLLIEVLREKYAILDEAIQNSDCDHEKSYNALDTLCERLLTSTIEDKNIKVFDLVVKVAKDMSFIRGNMDKEQAKQYLKDCWEKACKKSLKQLEQNDKD